MRTLTHPGPVAAQRRDLIWGQLGGEGLIRLNPGGDFMSALPAALAARGVRSGGLILLTGDVARLVFMTGGPDESGARAATPQGPHEIACPAQVLAGHAVFGLNAEGQPFMHCHAAFLDAQGQVRGGHLISHHCIAGPSGILAAVTGIDGAGFRVGPDIETNFAIFQAVTDLAGAA